MRQICVLSTLDYLNKGIIQWEQTAAFISCKHNEINPSTIRIYYMIKKQFNSNISTAHNILKTVILFSENNFLENINVFCVYSSTRY